MSKVIATHGSSKLKETSDTWRAFAKSIDFILHLINTSDYLINISNPVNMIAQKAKYQFNGQFSYFYNEEMAKTTAMVSNLLDICYYTDEWSLYQFDSKYSVKEWIAKNEKLFTNMPILKSNFKDLVQYKYKGFILTNFDMDSIDAEYKENDNEDENDTSSESDEEWG